MDGTDKELGWEGTAKDVAPGSRGDPTGALGAALGGQMGDGGVEVPGISDAVTSAMVNHFAREFSKGSLTLWPQFVASARRYFNVTHGYVLRKCLWQLAPATSSKKKSHDGEIGGEKDWTARVYEGLEVDIEEPDLYIPTMGFVTYVLLCGLIRGLQEQFSPDVLSTTTTFAMVILIVETTVAKAVLFTAGAVNTPTIDLVALLGYKYFHLSMQLIFGLLLGRGHMPQGIIYRLLALAFAASCGVALWQALRRIARMQTNSGQECVTEVHKLVIKGLPVLQALIYYTLLPTWPKPRIEAMAAVAVETASAVAEAVVATTTVALAATNATGSLP